MAGFSTDRDRKIIPRWRTLAHTLRNKELESVASLRPRQEVPYDLLAQKKIDWRERRTVGHAADLVGAALILKREGEVTDVARFLLQNSLDISPWVRELAEYCLNPITNAGTDTHNPETLERSILHDQVRSLRRLLRTEMRDPIKWVEISRVYATLGFGEKAGQCMKAALQLAPNNRFVLRSASRLWICLDDPERAHYTVVKAERTRHDPWLLSAEIALGSIVGKRSRFLKTARQMLSKGRFAAPHMSELASAVATLDLESGSFRKSRDLFRLSLAEPTENSIAQAAWASRQHNVLRLEDRHLLSHAFEARFWDFYHKSRWKEAVGQCKLWQFDQPFSSWPSCHGSFVAAIALEDYETSKEFAQIGLRANPKDFTLLNNLAFAHINLGDLREAEKILSRIDLVKVPAPGRVVFQATKGLLKFRSGNIEEGRKLYLDARAAGRAVNIHGERLVALATVFQAFEELSHDCLDRESLISEALQRLKQVREPIFRVLEDRLIRRTGAPQFLS